MSLSLYPIWINELAGSALMIVFSFLCVSAARRLKDKDPENVVWTYLLWVSISLAAFALSRAGGHILKRILVGAGYDEAWGLIKPYSGSVNTVTFFMVAAITLFFERIWGIYRQISKDRLALQKAHADLLFLNRNLEDLVVERTAELAHSERKYRRIFEVSQDLIAVVSPGGAIMDINPAGKEMLGIGNEEDLNPGLLPDFFHTEGDWEKIAETLNKTGFTPDMEVRLKRRDGASLSVILNTATEMDPDGNVSAIHLTAKDISQRKAMQQQLLLADKLASIGQLAAGIAHEINNPLSIILGYTQLLIRNGEEGTQSHHDHKKIEKATLACKTIVTDLLSFSRSARTRKTVGHIHDAFREILSVVQNQFNLEGVEIGTDFDPDLPKMVVDEGKIKQVIMNLLMNAKQAIRKNGKIDIRTRYLPHEGKALIEVRDTGCGIEREFLPRIFDPFFTTKPTGEGTGLGLSVSYGIVKDHGGEILVESEPGKGSLFTVVLPVILHETGQPA
ncbi:MAG: ATP-binding protein [Syntrophobacteraceae bacterium]